MKVKNRERKFDIQKIHIDKDSLGNTIISYVINGQYIEQCVSYVYLDSILETINDFVKVLSCEDYVIQK